MKRSDPRRGVILVTVLWSIAMLSALAMAAAVTFRAYAGVMALERDRVQADALLSAGLETAAGIIDTLDGAPLSNIETTVSLATGSARVRLSDEGGRIDVGKAPAVVLAALLRSVGAPPAAADDVAQRIVERRYRPGATGSDPARRPPATRTPVTSQPFSDLGQLQLIQGMAPQWLASIEPLTTIFGSETINPLTAPPAVIAALPAVDKSQVDAFLKTRRIFPADVDRLVRTVGDAQQYLAVKPQRVASIELVAELANGYAAAARAVIVVLPQDGQPYRVLVWTPVPSPRFL
jgi:type II secretory pathway component PulK